MRKPYIHHRFEIREKRDVKESWVTFPFMDSISIFFVSLWPSFLFPCFVFSCFLLQTRFCRLHSRYRKWRLFYNNAIISDVSWSWFPILHFLRRYRTTVFKSIFNTFFSLCHFFVIQLGISWLPDISHAVFTISWHMNLFVGQEFWLVPISLQLLYWPNRKNRNTYNPRLVSLSIIVGMSFLLSRFQV